MRVPSLDTEVPVIDWGKRYATNSVDAFVRNLDFKLTADAAVTARGLHNAVRWMRPDAVDVCDRARRAVVHTRSTGYARALRKALGRTKDETCCGTAAGEPVDKLTLNLITSMETSAAVNAQ